MNSNLVISDHKRSSAVYLSFAAALLFCVVPSARGTSPLSPKAALADFQVPAGLRVELVAAEPEVVDPVAIAFDEEERLWVVEMRDYPTVPSGKKPSSRIRVLRDRDGDGRYESATTFVDGLLFPTGVQPWRGGVIATLAGEIAFFPDANRDDVADGKEVWYRGFATQNEQLRANHPTLAADGLVYVAGGLRGGNIVNLRDPIAEPLSINGRDFAFDPVSGRCQAASGNGQFGLAFDDFNRRFTCSNRNPLVQVMIEQRYLQQNPQLIFPVVVQDVAAPGDASRLYPRTRALTTAYSHAGQFTAACGVEIFRGNRISDEYHGNAFICEPTANLVHREVLSPNGAAFVSKPLPEKGEFLTSTDEWFRPVNLANGPDGALYVVDMYRAVIEHPAWMPEDLRDRADLRLGNDQGRIYRIVADRPRERTSLTIARNPQGLLKLLEHPNAWQRETAARMILESGQSNRTELQKLATNSNIPATRVQALWLLDRLERLDEKTLLNSLADASPGVREQALIQAEGWLVDSPRLAERVVRMAGDTDPRVRFQAALSMSMLPATESVKPLSQIAVRDATDEWTCRAVALASRDRAGDVLANVLQATKSNAEQAAHLRGLIRELTAAVIATGDAPQAASLLEVANKVDAAILCELLLAFASALESRNTNLDSVLKQLERNAPEAHATIARQFERDIVTAQDHRAALPRRVEAVQLLRHYRQPTATEALLRLIEHDSPQLQAAAIDALVGHEDPRITESVIAQFPSQLPSVRRASLDLLLANEKSSLALLQAVEAERIAAIDVDALRAEQLRQHADAQVRELAQRVLGAKSTDRAEVVRHYQSALALTPNRQNGRKVFAANCATCHRLGDEGTALGPDIGDASLRTSAQLLADILQPNLAVDANYVSYTAVTQEGRVYQGVIRAESEAGISLITANGKSVTIPRKALESLNSSGLSLMPDGLERQISPQQMADLIGYLKGWRDIVR